MVANIIVLAGSLAGFILGIILFMNPNKPLFAKMITLAIGCVAYGRCFQIVRMLTSAKVTTEFQLGFLGVIGSLIFLFSVNFGLLDKTVDDKSKKNRAYRLIPIAAPLAALVLYLVFLGFADTNALTKIVGAALTFFAVQSSYFNLKHLIFPDKNGGVLSGLRVYNLLALVYSFLCIFEMIALSRGNLAINLVISVVMGIVVFLMIPTAIKGVKRWNN